jgi:uncharacterized oxidoreductase
MKMTGNTILITGGGSGIGHALAVEFAKLGNEVIITGRRREPLQKATAGNPKMHFKVLDVTKPADIEQFAQDVATEYPQLNVVINNAGIMKPENWTKDPVVLDDALATIETNLVAPIRMTAALLPLLIKQPHATVMTVSSGLASIPMAVTPTYCATKAAIHSWSQSLRYQLRQTSVEVLELVPPYVATELMGERQAKDPNAMPLGEFISDAMEILKTQPHATEILVKRVYPLRFAETAGQEKYQAQFKAFNDQVAAASH